MPPKPQTGAVQELSNRDQASFRTVVNLYDSKQYKKAIKLADSILKTNPEHAPTMAMKGLCLGCIDKRDEAYMLVREAIKINIRSTTCWHALGLLYRGDLNNVEAMKSYKMALRHDPTNVQLLRDLGILQMHLRKYRDLQETRRELLTARSNVPAHWMGFAVAHHMTRNYTMAIEILKSYERTLPADRKPDIESNNLKFYMTQLLEEAGDLSGALAVLDSDAVWFINKTDLSIRRADLLTKLGRFDEAAPLWREHLAINPENYAFHRGLQCCVLKSSTHAVGKGLSLPSDDTNLTPDQVDGLVALYAELSSLQPKCRAHKRIPLSFLHASAPAFRDALAAYMNTSLYRGIPSVFSELKPLYQQAGKPAVIESVLLSSLDTLKAGTLPESAGVPAPKPGDAATTLLWTLLFAGKHYDTMGDRVRALELAEEAIAHTPTVPDLYLFKGRVLKHLGRLWEASDAADYARKLDLSDRYLNSKSTKYKLRAGRIEEAKATISLFARDSADAMANVRDVQTVWFELECAHAYARAGNLGMALKNYLSVQKHFDDYFEGQYDYHGYTLRKFTMSQYHSFIAFQDDLFVQPAYVTAVSGIVSCYLRLQADRESAAAKQLEEEEAGESEDSKLSAADKKKLKAQRRREKQKKEKEEAKKVEAAAAATGGAASTIPHGNVPTAKDEDPDGSKLLAVELPIEEAQKHVVRLAAGGSKSPQCLQLVCDVALRRKKYVQAIKAVNQALAIDRSHPAVFTALSNTLSAASKALSDSTVELPDAVRTVLQEFVSLHLGAAGSVTTLAESYLAASAGSLAKCVAAGNALAAVDVSLRKAAVDAIVRCDVCATTSADCQAAVKALEGWGETDAATALKLKCKDVFPRSDAFDPSPADAPPALATE